MNQDGVVDDRMAEVMDEASLLSLLSSSEAFGQCFCEAHCGASLGDFPLWDGRKESNSQSSLCILVTTPQWKTLALLQCRDGEHQPSLLG